MGSISLTISLHDFYFYEIKELLNYNRQQQKKERLIDVSQERQCFFIKSLFLKLILHSR